jgi:anti-sigma factor RsiW
MSEHHGGGALGAWRWNDPAQEEARQAQHTLLIDLLGAYVDEELPPETASQLDAHLVGCARCRREVQLQLALKQRLAAAPVPVTTPALRERVLAATARLPLPPEPAAEPSARVERGEGAPGGRWTRRVRPWLVGAIVALAAAGGWGAWQGRAGGDDGRPQLTRLAIPMAGVPLLADAASDFQRIAAADLPGPARDLDAVRAAVGFPVEPLTRQGVRLLGAWTTTLRGEPAAVLAYRWDDRLVVQYIVPDELFFRHPALRTAAATHRALGATDGTVGIVAWPLAAAGAVLVGADAPERLVGALAR